MCFCTSQATAVVFCSSCNNRSHIPVCSCTTMLNRFLYTDVYTAPIACVVYYNTAERGRLEVGGADQKVRVIQEFQLSKDNLTIQEILGTGEEVRGTYRRFRVEEVRVNHTFDCIRVIYIGSWPFIFHYSLLAILMCVHKYFGTNFLNFAIYLQLQVYRYTFHDVAPALCSNTPRNGYQHFSTHSLLSELDSVKFFQNPVKGKIV